MAIEVFKNPDKTDWKELVKRPSLDLVALRNDVREILEEIKEKGDQAAIELTKKFDGVEVSALEVPKNQWQDIYAGIDEQLRLAIDTAAQNIRAFHQPQLNKEYRVETSPGVLCWRKPVAIEKVGIYAPGGTAPLFSSVLMMAIPAKVAGCKEIILVTPPDKSGNIHPAIVYAAHITGVDKIYKIGGAQAIAALAYGTESIPQVDKICGPGNQYVTCAKQMVSEQGTAIDMPAGPSEVLVIADQTSKPSFVAADLLSQAEHGADSQVVLLCDDIKFIDRTLEELELQIKELPRMQLARKALDNSKAILLKDWQEMIEFSNLYAPEHLIIQTENYTEIAREVTQAGSVFLGQFTPESAGDYASGTNHTLPTNGYARAYSGLSVESFVKYITFQEISSLGIEQLGDTIEIMAENESLQAHKNAVSIRRK